MTIGQDGWVVRPVSGSAARKPYLCPHCLHDIAAGQPHVVVWPEAYVAGDPTELRRHWHTGCWNTASRKRSRGSVL